MCNDVTSSLLFFIIINFFILNLVSISSTNSDFDLPQWIIDKVYNYSFIISDKDGKLPLSKKQKERFSKWLRWEMYHLLFGGELPLRN